MVPERWNEFATNAGLHNYVDFRSQKSAVAAMLMTLPSVLITEACEGDQHLPQLADILGATATRAMMASVDTIARLLLVRADAAVGSMDTSSKER